MVLLPKNRQITIEMLMELLYKIVLKYSGISGLIKK